MYPMTSLYTTLAQNGAVGRGLLDCDECKKPLYMSAHALHRTSSAPKTIGFISKENPELEWDESNAVYYDSNGKEQRGVPDDFICPLSQSIMVDPVVASDSHTYEFSWLQAYANKALTTEMISPLTREIMDPTLKVYSNIVLRGMIYDFVGRHGGELQSKPLKSRTPRLLNVFATGSNMRLYHFDDSEPKRISHYAVSDIMTSGTFYLACVCDIVSIHTQTMTQVVYTKGFKSLDSDESLQNPDFAYRTVMFSVPLTTATSFIAGIAWVATENGVRLHVTVYSEDVQEGGLYIYHRNGNLQGIDLGRIGITSSALVQDDHGRLKYILQYQHVKDNFVAEMYTLHQRVGTQSHTYQISTQSSVRPDIIQIGVVENDIVALLESGAVMKYNHLEPPARDGLFDTNLETELVSRPPVYYTAYMVTGSGMFAVFTMTTDFRHLRLIVYDSAGKKLVEDDMRMTGVPAIPRWTDFNIEGRSIIPTSGPYGTFSVFFMAFNTLHEVQFVIDDI
jgi:hypothetical protein